MNKITVFSEKSTTQSSLPKYLEGKVNTDLLAQAIYVYQDRQHPGLAKAKTRADVSITKKKIYKQKGTGGARHGAKSAPIFVGGGVTHGPKGIKRVLRLSSSLRKKALQSAIVSKVEKNRVVAIEKLTDFEKTSKVAAIVKNINKELKISAKSILFVIPEEPKSIKHLVNIANSQILKMSSLNAYDIMTKSLVIFDSSLLEKTQTKSAKTKKETKK